MYIKTRARKSYCKSAHLILNGKRGYLNSVTVDVANKAITANPNGLQLDRSSMTTILYILIGTVTAIPFGIGCMKVADEIDRRL